MDQERDVDEEKHIPEAMEAGRALLVELDPAVQQQSRLIDLFCIALNTSTTIIIVFVNKIIFSDIQLRKCQVSLAAWHFTATVGVLYCASQWPFRMFTAAAMPLREVLPIATLFTGFLVLGNMSLVLNPIGFYQLTKTLITPAVVVLNFCFFQKRISIQAFLAVVMVCIGVVMASAVSAKSNSLGATVASVAVTVTALYQILVGMGITDKGISAPQLLMNQASVSVPMLVVLAVFVDTVPNFATVPYNIKWAVILSGLIASLLNLSQFLVIGRTSALTYNIVSQIKTVVIIAATWYREGKQFTLQDTCGVALAVGGAWAYTYFSAQTRLQNNRRNTYLSNGILAK